jgi:NAD(P)-dependent dehydrogenase (short-subunit alcohol dehydrogenase family)
VNLSASFYLSQAVVDSMVERGFGRIVHIGSVTATLGNAMQVGYGAAKAGLFGLTRSMARALIKKGVTVNCVVPGIFATDMMSSMDPAMQEVIRKLIPMGRHGRPEELAHAVISLLDERASYITGQTLTVDGGISWGD